MDLFIQMFSFVRTQQVIAFKMCVVTKNMENINFIIPKCIVSNSYLLYKNNVKRILDTFLITERPLQSKDMNDYYQTFGTKWESNTQEILNNDKNIISHDYYLQLSFKDYLNQQKKK